VNDSRMRAVILFLLIGLPLAGLAQTVKHGATQAAALPLWGDLEPGPYQVGFQVLYKIDESRSYYSAQDNAQIKGRPIRIMVWYPARAAGTPMQFADYLHVEPSDPRLTQWNREARERDQSTARRQFAQTEPGPLYEKLINCPVAAYANAPLAKGKFPLLLHSVGRNDHQQANTVLWEYLASHGYVIATVPQLGASLASPRLAFTPKDVERQRLDVEFALAELRRFPVADAERVALMGHSAGPVVALLIAAKERGVDALVSLDGAQTTKDGREVLAQSSFNAAQIRVPLLNIYRANDTHGLDYVVNSLRHSERYNLAVDPQITHFDFGNWPLYSIFSAEEDPRGKPYRPAKTAREFHLTMCRYVLKFLAATLKGERAALPYIKGEKKLGTAAEALLKFQFQAPN
jgi:dienelactone hydrolase